MVLLGPGCSFRRVTTNEWVRDADKSDIRVGESRWIDVMEALTLPPSDVPEEVGIRLVGRDLFRYATVDARCFTLGLEQLLLVTPFRWCSERYVYELAVEFDEDGVVRSVYETTRGNFWPPFQGEGSAAPVVTRGLGGTPDP